MNDPTSAETAEHKRFQALQARFAAQYEEVFARFEAPRTIVILPSLSLDHEILEKIAGAIHYEQRFLCLLFLLRFPNAKIIYVTSLPTPPAIVDYYLHCLPGVPKDHAMARLHLLSCHDASHRPLTAKVLERPRLIDRIKRLIDEPRRAHLTCFSVTALERRLALMLETPIYGCDPALAPLGSKSGSRRLFREAGVRAADGVEDLADGEAAAEALTALKRRTPGLRRAVVKLNEGFSGDGNALFDFTGAPEGAALSPWIKERLPKMRFVAADMEWGLFAAKLREMGGVAEAFVEGRPKRSPSVQLRVDPGGALEVISTHEQVTGGASGQVFEGCVFPADAAYRAEIQAAARRVGERLREEGALGRFAVDFISVRDGREWVHYAVEINLRKGGTTHPFLTLQCLTEGACDPDTGIYRSAAGKALYYYATDTLQEPHYRGLTPDDLIEIAVANELHFHAVRQEGVVFHLIGALSEHGKLGAVCIAGSPAAARRLFQRTKEVLDREGRRGLAHGAPEP